MKLKLTITCEYEVTDNCYGSVEEVIKMDQDNPLLILDTYLWTVKIKEIK